MPRLIDIRRGDDHLHYTAVVRFNQRAYRVIQYPLNKPPRTELELYREGERFRTERAARQRLDELAKCQHRVYDTDTPNRFICVVQTSDTTYGVYESPEYQYPQESGRLIRVCPTYKFATRIAEREAKREIQIPTASR